MFSKGPCWARHRAQNFFNEEDFFLQVDSHTQFAPKWDSIFIEKLEEISANQKIDEYFKKPIITSYPRSFKVLDFEKGLFELNTGDKHTQVITYRKDSLFLKGSFSRQIGFQQNILTLLMQYYWPQAVSLPKAPLSKKFHMIQITIFMGRNFHWQ